MLNAKWWCRCATAFYLTEGNEENQENVFAANKHEFLTTDYADFHGLCFPCTPPRCLDKNLSILRWIHPWVNRCWYGGSPEGDRRTSSYAKHFRRGPILQRLM